MRRRIGMMLVCGLLLGAPAAHASLVSRALGTAWDYATVPVNCLAELGTKLLNAGTEFITCFLSNMNPSKLVP